LYFDTHAHINQKTFNDDRDEMLAKARQAGVNDVVCIGVSAESSEACVALAQAEAGVHAAVGIQPNYVHEAEPNDWDRVLELSKADGVVAVGETGLDRYWDDAPFDLQQDYFDRHLRLSQETGLPFVVHMRECEEDIMVMLREAHARGPLAGIMHSFTGPTDMAAECVAMGLHISFAGMVTYKKSDELREVSATVPLNRLLIETDAPYLSPEPVRKIRRNEPAHIIHTCACLAKARGATEREVAMATTANAKRLFKL